MHRRSAAADGPTCDPSQRSRFAPIHIGSSTLESHGGKRTAAPLRKAPAARRRKKGVDSSEEEEEEEDSGTGEEHSEEESSEEQEGEEQTPRSQQPAAAVGAETHRSAERDERAENEMEMDAEAQLDAAVAEVQQEHFQDEVADAERKDGANLLTMQPRRNRPRSRPESRRSARAVHAAWCAHL